MAHRMPIIHLSRALRPAARCKVEARGFSSKDGSSVDDVIGDFVNRKWKKKNSVDTAAQVWPTDRALTEAVEPAPKLQGHWESLERRVANRRPRTDRPSGRTNLRKGEEDFWLAGGAYDGLGILSTKEESQNVDGEKDSSVSAEPSVEAPSSSPFPSSSEIPHGMLEALASGEVARYTTVAVANRSAASVFVEAYGERVVPVASKVQGYKRGLLLHDGLGSSVHVVSVWSSPEALAAAGNNAEYSEAMATVAKHFAGPPQVRDLEVLAEFGPKTS